MDDPAGTLCIAISERSLLAAAADGRSWLIELHSTRVDPLPVSRVAAHHQSVAASAVEGAIAAGLAHEDSAAPSPQTLPRYIRWLVGNYIFAGQTPVLFRRGAERFQAAGRTDLANVCLKKAAEEAGHARLAYRDLGALGLPAAAVIKLVPPPSAGLFAGRFRDYVESDAPIALFGFSYCLERMAVERDANFIRNIEALCPAGSGALNFLKVHSAVGSDSAHVYEQLSIFESLDEAELATVARAAYETAQVLAQQPSMDEALSDGEINRRLRSHGISMA